MGKTSTVLKVALADDHALVRAGIRSLLEALEWVEVVGEANDGREALALIAEKQPNIALLDISMPGLNGLETAAQVTSEFPQTKIIILSMHASEQYVARALRAGVSGYLLKDAAREELDLALRTVRAGQVYLSSSLSKNVLKIYLKQTEAAEFELTSRQRQILQLLAESKNSKEIALVLDVSPKTIEAHRAQIMERLGIHDLPGLVRYAIQQGLSSLED
ncbi:MAG: response regulator transcription factor [Verrucomicrobiales bacterium]